jgi:acetyl-CoA carboxylase biotin carboxylase subunit
MVGKLIVHAPTRDEAIARMHGALGEFRIGPIKTIIPLHRRLMETPQFVDAEFDIHYVERMLKGE